MALGRIFSQSGSVYIYGNFSTVQVTLISQDV